MKKTLTALIVLACCLITACGSSSSQTEPVAETTEAIVETTTKETETVTEAEIETEIETEAEIEIEEEAEISTEGDADSEYDIDQDLLIFSILPEEDMTSQYYIVFAEYDGDTLLNLYTFSNHINPRDMGKNFNAVGGFPDWFQEGEMVHVKANLRGDNLSTKDFSVTPIEE